VKVSKGRKIIALEPIDEVFEQLKKNFTNFNNITLLNFAAGRISSPKLINITSNNGMSSSFLEMSPIHILGAPTVKKIRTQRVKVRKLSSIIREYDLIDAYLKIDVQGYELEVLKSINIGDWSKIKFIEVEVNLVESYESASLIEEIVSFLRIRNFKPFRIEPGFGLKDFGQQLQMDILFCRKD
jgi:FkbM family methyltransferase